MKVRLDKSALRKTAKSVFFLRHAHLMCVALALAMGPNQVLAKSRAVGTSYVFTLEGNPGTGYKWMLDEQASSGTELVSIESLGYQAPSKTGKKLIGAPSPYAFRITCLSAGFSRLIFNYVPPSGETVEQTHETWVRCE